MRQLLYILTLILITGGCQKIECPAYDFNHAINKWNWFPDNEQEYEFMNVDSTIINLVKTKFVFNQYEERRCHSCACFSDLENCYEINSLNIQFRVTLSYQSDDSSDEGSIYYGVDSIGSPFEPIGETINEIEVSDYETKEFNVTLLDSLTLIFATYKTVTQLEIINSIKSDVQKIWVVPDKGIIGLNIKGNVWESR